MAGSGSTTPFTDGTGTSATFNNPTGVAISPDGSFALIGEYNNRVRRLVLATRVVTTLAGSSSAFADGTGTSASFKVPIGIAISSDSTFALIVDSTNNRLRSVVIATGVVSTLAGSGTATFADGQGASASFNGPYFVAISPDGLFALVTDSGNNRLRRVALPTGAVTTLVGSSSATFADGTVRIFLSIAAFIIYLFISFIFEVVVAVVVAAVVAPLSIYIIYSLFLCTY